MIQAVLHATQALLDGLIGEVELLRGNSAIVVLQSDAVVAPYEGCAACAAACGNARAAFARFAGFASFWGEPVEGSGSRGEVAGKL